MAIIAPDIGIDIGTANTRIYVKGKGIVVDEPSVLAVDRGGRHAIRAIGEEARSLLGRTSGDVSVIRPMADGMVRDFDMMQAMLQYFVRKAIGASRLVKPRAVMTVPSRITPIERRAQQKGAGAAGVRDGHLHFVEKPFAAAYGAGLPVFEPLGSMIVDIGGGTTEAAVISLGGIVSSRSIRIGGVKMDEAIIAYIKREFNMLIGDRMAEEIKMTLGAAVPRKDERKMTVRGRDMITNLPQTVSITTTAVHEALQAPCQAILSAIHHVLEHTPPELAGDIMKNGIHLTGGGSQLFGMDQYITRELDIQATLVHDPMGCAANGVGRLVEKWEELQRISASGSLYGDGEE